MTNETENLVVEILRRLQGDMAELKSGQQDMRHRLSLIETRLAGMERNLSDQYAGYAGQSVRIDRLEERLDRLERRLELTD
jgi:uncharacterized coiled-coil protein SlyX